MAFKLLNDVLITNDKDIRVDGNDVLVGDGNGNVVLQNVTFGTQVNSDIDTRINALLLPEIATLDTTLRADFASADTATLALSQTYTDTQIASALSTSSGGSIDFDSYVTDIELASYNYITQATLDSAISNIDTSNNATFAYVDTATAAAVVNASQYTDTREDAIRTDFATADQSILTQAQAYTDSVVVAGTGNLTTDDIPEGANLYYTDARADARVALGIDSLVNGANAAFDTLKEIQDAMATDAELASAISNLSIPDITGLATETYVDTQLANAVSGGTIDLSGYVTDAELASTIANINTFSGDYNDLTNKPTLFSGSYNDLTDIPQTEIDLSPYALQTQLFSGSYNDLTDTPTIPSIAGLATEAYVDQAEINAIATSGAYTDAQIASAVSSGTIDLSNYATTVDLANALAGLVNGADAAFDTLKEIQDAMATDAELATAISNLSIPTVPTDVSAFTNDAGYLTAHQDLSAYALQTQLFSGSYNDLTDTPVIPSVTGLASETYVDNAVAAIDTFSGQYADLTGTPTIPTVPTNVSAFTNDAGYLTSVGTISYNDLTNTPTIPSITGLASETYVDSAVAAIDTFSGNYNDLTNKPTIPSTTGLASETYVDTAVAAIDTFSGNYNDLTNKPTLFDGNYDNLTNKPTIPSTTGLASETYVDNAIDTLVGGAGAAFDTLVEIQNAMATDAELATAINGLSIPTDVSDLTDTTNLLDHFSGSYNDLTNKPTIPTVPTNVSEFTNDAGYLTSVGTISYNSLSDKPTLFDGNYNSLTNKPLLFSGNYNDLTNKPTIPTVPTNVSAFTNDAGYVTTDTNTTYSAGNGLSLSGTTFAMSGSFTGNFTATGDVTAYSDRALKRNIQTIEGALQKVTEMRGVTFLKDGKASTGVIAQEIETVLPEVVHQDNYGMRSVAYGNIVGTLIEAIKEQQVQIEKLQSEIAEMKKK